MRLRVICGTFRKMAETRKKFKRPYGRAIKLSVLGSVVLVVLLIGLFIRKCGTKEPQKESETIQKLLPFGAVVEGLKGVDLSGIQPDQKVQVLYLLNVANCLASDGMMSVARCRRDVPSCVTSQRMADFIINGVKEGLADEVILTRLYEKAAREGGARAQLEDKKTLSPRNDLPYMGSADAPVTVTVLYDYTSSFSRHAVDEVMGMFELYPRQVRVVFWPSPRGRLNPVAEKAARVALAAYRLKKFDSVHQSLLDSEGEIGEGKLDSFTEDAGLPPDALNQEAIAEPVRGQLSALENKASELGVGFSPAVFISGWRAVGAIPSMCFLVGAVQRSLMETVTNEYDSLETKIGPQ